MKYGPIAMMAACAAIALLAGCGPDNEGTPTATGAQASSASAAEVPAGFDPCAAVQPSTVFAPYTLLPGAPDDSSSGGAKWKGCGWNSADAYSATISTTNLTVDDVSGKKFADAQRFEVDGRQAISTRQSDSEKLQSISCTINVSMKGGSLEIKIMNPESASETGTQDACQITRGVADKVVPLIPADA